MARATIEPMLLSGSTNGLGIKIAATATPGTLIHTATSGTLPSGATQLDKIYLSVYNSHTTSVAITLEWGGVTDPDHQVRDTSIPFRSGEILLIPGRYLTGGLIVRAFASVANVLFISGEIERVTLE